VAKVQGVAGSRDSSRRTAVVDTLRAEVGLPMATLAVGILAVDSHPMAVDSHWVVADPNQVVALGMGRTVPRGMGRTAHEGAGALATLAAHAAEANVVGNLEVRCSGIGRHEATQAYYCLPGPRNRPYHSAPPFCLGNRQSRPLDAFGLLAFASPLASLLTLRRPPNLSRLEVQDPVERPSTHLDDGRIGRNLHVCTGRCRQTDTSLS